MAENDGVPQAVQDADDAANEALNLAAAPQTDAQTAQPASGVQAGPAAPGARAPSTPAAEPGGPATVSREEHEQLLHRWQSFKGTLKARDDRIAKLETTLSEMQVQLETLTKGPAKPGHLRLLTEEEASGFRPETLDVQGRLARGAAEEVVDLSEKRILAAVEQRIAALGQGTAPAAAPNRTVLDVVEDRVPGFKAMNDSDPKWFEFLNQPDSLDPTRLRREIGVEAFESNDPNALADLALEYQRSNPAHSPAVRLQLKPDTGASGGGQPPSGQRIWKESEVRAFFTAVAKGTFIGTDQDADALETEVESAANEGRVIYGQ